MKRIIIWTAFAVIVVLIVVGMIAAARKHPSTSEVAIPLPTEVSSADHIRGNPNATTTLVEYGDFQCPACQAYYPVVEEVFAMASSSVRMVFREFPLPQHADALPAAKAAEAAGDQGQFWQMYNLLYSNHADWDSLSDPTSVFDGYAQKLGLDMTRFAADMASPAAAALIQASADAGAKAGIDATPTFFVNGYRIENPESLPEFLTDLGLAAAASSTDATNP